MLNDSVLHCVENTVLCWLASVTPAGMPSVSPKEIFTAADDKLLPIAGPEYASRHVIRVQVNAVKPVFAPSYRLYPQRTEQKHSRRTQQRFGVQAV